MFFSTENSGNMVGVFSLTHILLLVLTLIVPIWIVYTKKESIRGTRVEDAIRYAIISISIILEVGYIIWSLFSADEVYVFFGLCLTTLYVNTFALIKKKYNLLNITYFWLIGALLTVLTLEVGFGINRFRFWHYFMNHVMQFWAIAFGIIFADLKPKFKDFVNSFLILFVFGFIALIINAITGANHYYVSKPPMEGIPFYDLPYEISPYLYTLVWTITSFMIMGLLYSLPFTDKEDFGKYKRL